MNIKTLIRKIRPLLVVGGLAGSQLAFAQTNEFYKADIDNPVAGVVTDLGNGNLEIVAGGGDTWNNSDSFTYVYRQVTGDFDVQVRVRELNVDDPAQQDSGKAALMARTDLTPGSPNVQVNALPDEARNTIESIYRPVRGEGTDDMPDKPTSNTTGETPYPNVWLRMIRKQNQFTTLYSNSGTDWKIISSVFVDPAQFPRTLLIGLSTVAHIDANENAANRARATYSDFRFNSAIPETTVDGAPAADHAPGRYPDWSVTGVNWKVTVPDDGLGPDGQPIHYNAGNKNNYILESDGQGPIPWTAPGYNQGDMDINLAPRDPTAGLSNIGPYGPNYNTSVTAPDAAPAQGWFPTLQEGLLFGTVRKNGQQWNDGASKFYGFAWNSPEGSSRKGFSMLDGAFKNQDTYFSIGKLGETAQLLPSDASPAALREANINIALAWFPYAQGWMGGYVANPATSSGGAWLRHGTVSPALGKLVTAKNSAGAVVTWEDLGGGTYGGLATVHLPGINAKTAGMLFTLSNNEGNDNRGALTTAVPKQDGSGWTVAIRADDDVLDPASYADPERAEFQFLYVPYSAPKLIGGYVTGSTGQATQKAGDFTLTRAAAGQYELAIPGKTGANGMLLLQNAGFLPSNPSLADDSALSYEYVNGKFIIEARHVEAGGQGFDLTPLRDTDFYFAWVDFQEPLTALAAAPAEPSFNVGAPAEIHAAAIASREAGIAINTDTNEALVVTIETENAQGFLDPITGQVAQHIMVGYFVDPTTLAVKRGPFPIVGNPSGNMENHDVEYNPVSKKYMVVTTGQTYPPNGLQLIFGAMINSATAAGTNNPVLKTFVYDPETTESYDDVSLAVSTKNGNMLLVAERNFLVTGSDSQRNEGAVGILFDKDGTALTPGFTRLDVLQADGDEDDPEVVYLPSRDEFLFYTNTDAPAADALKNRIVGMTIQTTPNTTNGLTFASAQLIAEDRKSGVAQGHPAFIENPFNGQLVGAFDYDNGSQGGDLVYDSLAADGTFSKTGAQVAYLDAVNGTVPYAQRHPQLAAAPNNGVIALVHNFVGQDAALPTNGLAMTLLGPDGAILPGRPADKHVYILAETENPISTSANYYNVKFDVHSDTFIAVYNADGVHAVRVGVFSNHLPTSTAAAQELSLTASRSGNAVTLSWPVSSGYQLESADRLSGPWTKVSAAPVAQNGVNSIPVQAASGTAFFRLHKP